MLEELEKSSTWVAAVETTVSPAAGALGRLVLGALVVVRGGACEVSPGDDDDQEVALWATVI